MRDAEEFAADMHAPMLSCDREDLIRARDAEVAEQARAEAWDEGCAAGLREVNEKQRGVQNNPALNPYRIEREPATEPEP